MAEQGANSQRIAHIEAVVDLSSSPSLLSLFLWLAFFAFTDLVDSRALDFSAGK